MSGARTTRLLSFVDYPIDDGLVVNLPGYGTTAQRPAEPGIGDSYFDTTLTRPIWWTGAAWINAAGAPV